LVEQEKRDTDKTIDNRRDDRVAVASRQYDATNNDESKENGAACRWSTTVGQATSCRSSPANRHDFIKARKPYGITTPLIQIEEPAPINQATDQDQASRGLNESPCPPPVQEGKNTHASPMTVIKVIAGNKVPHATFRKEYLML
jgi:hypothetical protein